MKVIRKIYHGFIFLLTMLLFFFSFPLAFILYGGKKYWLISEVDFDARDNGIHFFNYINKEHPEVNSIYLISKNNPNYQLVKNVGRVVEPHTYKHMLIFIAAQAKISTLVHGCSPSGYVTKYLVKHHCTGKNIALKHGIFKNLHPNYFKKNAHLDLICCGAQPEYGFIDKEFGYKHGVAQYTGLARFDALHNLDIKKEILIMPTWRRWLDSIKDVKEFEHSDFYKNWFSLLNNKGFNKSINDCGYEVCFYVHPKLNKFIEAFNKAGCNVRFLNSKNGDSVQEHLKSAALLITDFSSVFFDFAYMKKPAVYFQFDEEQYYGSHYIKAYFDYRDNGFGDVCTDAKSVVDSISNVVNNNFRINEKYESRIDKFFVYRDDKNCERIYNAIMEIK